MNIKQLKEQRNALLGEAETLLHSVETETRSFSQEENVQYTALTKQVGAIDLQIAEEEKRSLKGEATIQNMEEKTNMENTEIRGIEGYLRKQDAEEVRALQTTTEGAKLIPEVIEGTIISAMEETSPVFAKARKFPSIAGNLKIAKENASTTVGFVGEGANLAEGAIGFTEIKLTQKRVGAAISLSNQLVNDSAIDIVDYSAKLLAKRAVKAIEKTILLGNTEDEFKGIMVDAEITNVEITGAVTVDTLMDIYNGIHPSLLGGSIWIMQRKFFNQVAKLKDGNNHFYMQNGVINGKLSYTLFGAEVVVTDALPDTTPVLFGSVEDGYAVMIKKGFALQYVTGDTTQALRGSSLLVLDGYMDGAVYNPEAFVKATVATV